MRLPDVLGRQLRLIERRYSGPIPKEEHLLAVLPQRHARYGSAEINEARTYCRWLCACEWKKVKASAYWARQTKDQSGLTAITDRERFGIAARRLKSARRLRDAWARTSPAEDPRVTTNQH
jgi:hypothetical protein